MMKDEHPVARRCPLKLDQPQHTRSHFQDVGAHGSVIRCCRAKFGNCHSSAYVPR